MLQIVTFSTSSDTIIEPPCTLLLVTISGQNKQNLRFLLIYFSRNSQEKPTADRNFPAGAEGFQDCGVKLHARI